MGLNDKRGNPVSHSSQNAVERMDKAIDLLAAYQADPVGEVQEILTEHPDFVLGHIFRAAALATATDKVFEAEALKSLRAAEALAHQANERERMLIAGTRAWLDGDLEQGVELWGRCSITYPRDLMTLQFAHVGDFFLGHSHMLRDRVARVLPKWSADVSGRGFVLGMYAFGLEESGEYSKAESCGREAVDLNGQDGWAVHAVAHVLEMQGRAHEGAKFLQSTSAGWEPGSMFSYHLWWHNALFLLENLKAQDALRLYDEKLAAGGFGQAMELLDGSALLWRLQLAGFDVGSRWTMLADLWETRLDHGYYVFNDVNAMMALVGAGRTASQARLLETVRRASQGSTTNAMMSLDVGLPACEAFVAFGRGEYGRAIELLLPLRGKASRYGGSHAQRDMFSWTMTEAAIRLGDRRLADAFVAERLSWKPESPLNKAWARRVAGMGKVG